MTLKSIACPLALLLAVTLPAVAQPAEEESSPTFGEIIDVRVINLEVVVTQRKERVMDLASEDFSLLVDGEEVPIEYFTEVVGGRAVESAAGGEGAIPALAPGEAVGTRFLVFIDDSFTIPSQRNRILRRLEEQLQFLGPDDTMAITAFDGREIDLLTSWTNSERTLQGAFQQARERRANGLQRRAQMSDYALAGSSYGFGSPFSSRRGYGGFGDYGGFGNFGGFRGFNAYPGPSPRGSLLYEQADQVVDAAASVMRAFAKPTGRKVMLLLSGGGWGVGGSSRFQSSVTYGNGRSHLGLMRPLIDTANRLGYTLYPIDVKGVETRAGGSAEYGSSSQANFANYLSREREWASEAGLIHLAEETGGRAFLDGAASTALQRAVEDTRSYYWIGFTPTWQENDSRHRVEVKVRGKGLKVRSRESFSDLSRQTEVTMLVESSQLFDLPAPGEDRELGVSFGEPTKGGFRKVIVPLRLEIPFDELTLLPTAEGFATQLELRVAATDDQGNRADIPVLPVEVRSEPGGEEDVAIYEISLKLRRRPHKMLLSLHEPASGNLITKRVALTL